MLVVANAADVVHVAEAATSGRRLDAGNPGLQVLDKDFARFGVRRLAKGTSGADRRRIDELLALRNAVAHGNVRERHELEGTGVVATPAWTRQARGALGRTATRLDLVTWNAMESTTGREPW